MSSDIAMKPQPAAPGILHFAVVGSIVLGIIFLSCWLLAFTPIGVTHAFISLFTVAEMTSGAALVEGMCWSLVFGAWLGFLIAVIHKFVAVIMAR